MRHIYIVGIGTGNPEHMTVQAINALNKVDVIFIPSKGAAKAELADVRKDICQRYVTNDAIRFIDYAVPVRQTADRSYVQSVDDPGMHRFRRPTKGCSRIIWRKAEVPPFSSGRPQSLRQHHSHHRAGQGAGPRCPRLQRHSRNHQHPGVDGKPPHSANLVGKPVQITTGRRLAESFQGIVETAVVMLDGEQAFSKVDDPDAYLLGRLSRHKDEITIAGRLADVSDRIMATRAEARARHGWIMDIYLLRKGQDFDEQI